VELFLTLLLQPLFKHNTSTSRSWCAKAFSMASINWRTINIDALDPESASNFDLSTLTPAVIPVSTSDVQTLSGQIRQLMRGGDNEGALRGALENVPYGADEQGKVCPATPPAPTNSTFRTTLRSMKAKVTTCRQYTSQPYPKSCKTSAKLK
jgi:hypothetical protein